MYGSHQLIVSPPALVCECCGGVDGVDGRWVVEEPAYDCKHLICWPCLGKTCPVCETEKDIDPSSVGMNQQAISDWALFETLQRDPQSDTNLAACGLTPDEARQASVFLWQKGAAEWSIELRESIIRLYVPVRIKQLEAKEGAQWCWVAKGDQHVDYSRETWSATLGIARQILSPHEPAKESDHAE